jgi:hypothetical protein
MSANRLRVYLDASAIERFRRSVIMEIAFAAVAAPISRISRSTVQLRRRRFRQAIPREII